MMVKIAAAQSHICAKATEQFHIFLASYKGTYLDFCLTLKLYFVGTSFISKF